ncbi:MAG: extracellular solute-binding protein [Candidatus Sericytochromatia bacterium]|nr:extracellular solute-binding protein [Candidatus Sericytochromatia bacterium]
MPVRPHLSITCLLATALTLTSLVACDSGTTANSLVLWHAWGGAELSALRTLSARYQAQFPGREVLLLQVPYDKLKDKYIRSTAANGGPDLVIGDADWSGKFAASELALRIDNWFSEAELSRFHPGALAALKRGDRLCAIPESRETVALYYNRRHVTKPPTTVEELLALSAAIGRQSADKVKGFVFNGEFYYAMGWFFGAGARLFEESGRVAVASEAANSAVSLVGQLAKAPGVMVSHEYAKPDSWYKQGQAAMIVNGPWALVDYQKALGDGLGVAKLPRWSNTRASAPWVGVKCLMFNPNSDDAHRRMAKDFALFVTSPESQALLAEQAGHIPAIRGYTAPEGSPLAVFNAQADEGTPVSISPDMAAVWEPMNKALRKVVQGEAPTPEALGEAARSIQAKVDEIRAHQP